METQDTRLDRGAVSLTPAKGDELGGLQHNAKKAVSVNRIKKTTQHLACAARAWSGTGCWLGEGRWLKGVGKGSGQGGSLNEVRVMYKRTSGSGSGVQERLEVSAEMKAAGLEEGLPEVVMGSWFSEGVIFGFSSMGPAGGLRASLQDREARMAQPALSRGPAVKDAREIGREGMQEIGGPVFLPAEGE